MITNILTFDIEDNFEQDELVDPLDWERYEGQVLDNTTRILNLLKEFGVKSTFFILGKVAERKPEIVRAVYESGHEIATHGYAHQPVVLLGKKGFEEDTLRAKEIIESIIPVKTKGYRARSFSVQLDTIWALQVLRKIGFSYDSSILSSRLVKVKKLLAHIDGFQEIPPTSVNFLGTDLPLGGGFLFRILPISYIERQIRSHNLRGLSFHIYAHAWEFNKDQPDRRVSAIQSFLQAPFFYTMETKLRKLLGEYPFTSIEEFMCRSTN